MPHQQEPSPLLWWYRQKPGAPAWANNNLANDSERIVEEFLRRYARGRTPEENFKDDLLQWLHDLNTEQKLVDWNKQPKAKRYWTVDAYARANKLEPPTLMARLRKLEKIAKEFLPGRVPRDRKNASISDEQKNRIRAKYLKIVEKCVREDYPFDHHLHALSEVAKKFDIKPFRAGQICKPIRDTERKKAAKQPPLQSPPLPQSELDPFSG